MEAGLRSVFRLREGSKERSPFRARGGGSMVQYRDSSKHLVGQVSLREGLGNTNRKMRWARRKEGLWRGHRISR